MIPHAAKSYDVGTIFFPHAKESCDNQALVHRRHVTLPIVDSAVELCRYTYGKCEELLQRDEDEDARPEDASSWRAWFEHKKNGVSRCVSHF
jgi:hypothetical protein